MAEPFEPFRDSHTPGLAGLDDATRQAAYWLALRHDPETTGFDAQAFQAWLDASPANRAAYIGMEELWQAGGEAAAIPATTTTQLAARGLSRRAFGRRALAAGLAAIAVTGAGTLALAPAVADFQTAPGETARVALPDGTTAELSTDTALRLAFDATERRVELLSGEAFFAVAKDADRPFRVTTDGTEAEAMGTAFSVARLADDGARVAVTEHAVNVSTGSQRCVVRAGECVVSRRGRLGEVETSDPARELAWRMGKLVFLDQPLGEVVAELDRWRKGRTMILDAGLRQRPVTVVLDTRRAAEGVAILARAVAMRWMEVTPYLTLVYGTD